jgi:transketolase
MRAAFVQTLMELAGKDSRVLLLTGDLGFNVVEPFVKAFPDRFLNVGVAEQNMVGVATGLAEEGFIPFVYSIATFASLRPYEFIRNGPALHQFPVRICGVGGGFEYGHAGATHYALEDIGVMRVQPAITVLAPADAQQAQTALRASWDLPGPVYYRLGKEEKTVVPGLEGRFELGRIQIVREGRDLVFVAMGALAVEAVAAAELLQNQGVSCAVAVLSSLNPAPVEDLVLLLSQFPSVWTIESHYLSGAAGSLVAEVIAEHGIPCRLTRCGVAEMPHGVSGGQHHMQQANRLNREDLVQRVLGRLRP